MKLLKVILIIILILFVTDNASAKSRKKLFEDVEIPAGIAECIASVPPSVSEIHRLAIKYARLKPADLTKWKKNIKYSALLPRLQFSYERKVTDSFDIDLDDSVSVTSSAVNVGPTASGWGRGLDRNNNVEVTAVWYLDEILFNRDDLSISSEARSQISARRDLLDQITEDYFELKRLVSLYRIKSQEEVSNRGLIRLEIEKLIGRLDAVTGGWFNRMFKWKGVRCE